MNTVPVGHRVRGHRVQNGRFAKSFGGGHRGHRRFWKKFWRGSQGTLFQNRSFYKDAYKEVAPATRCVHQTHIQGFSQSIFNPIDLIKTNQQAIGDEFSNFRIFLSPKLVGQKGHLGHRVQGHKGQGHRVQGHRVQIFKIQDIFCTL